MRARIVKNSRRSIQQRNASVRAAIEQMESRMLFNAFTPGDLVVYRVGNGSAALGSAATAVYLDEYTPSGTLVQSIPMPTAASGANNPLTATGNSANEGELELSSNGETLLAPGYYTVPGTASPGFSNSSTTGKITGATNASPIVITTSSTSGMTNGTLS